VTDERIPVAIYARYSTDRQDSRSIDDQIRRCRAFAASRGLEVAAEYKDAAQSGAHLERADMQRMLAAARRGRHSPFRAVLVDDLSRLSRDLGNTWRIVFEDLAAADVRVIDCTTGMASDGAGARLTFGALALVNDAFLQLVKTETHRGLEGRALGGFWTGGRVYGYRTEIEPNPPDLEHPRKVPRLEPSEAAIVRRVFEQYAGGESTKQIAGQLNADGVRAPYDGDYTKPAGRGWGHTTIRAMLRNDGTSDDSSGTAESESARRAPVSASTAFGRPRSTSRCGSRSSRSSRRRCGLASRRGSRRLARREDVPLARASTRSSSRGCFAAAPAARAWSSSAPG